PGLVHLHGYLVGGPAHALAAHFHRRLDMFHRLGEDIDGVTLGHAFLDLVHGIVKDADGSSFLALPHEAVDELAGQLGVEAGIRFESIRTGGAFAGHDISFKKSCELCCPNPKSEYRNPKQIRSPNKKTRIPNK